MHCFNQKISLNLLVQCFAMRMSIIPTRTYLIPSSSNGQTQLNDVMKIKCFQLCVLNKDKVTECFEAINNVL